MLTGDDFQNYSTVLEKPAESTYQGMFTIEEDKISDIRDALICFILTELGLDHFSGCTYLIAVPL